MAKIYIIGSVGSGKTTLAKRLSEQISVPFYELDNVTWKSNPGGDIKRSRAEIDEIFLDIINKDDWIIENVGRSFFDKGFEKADTIIYLNLTRKELYERVILRWIKQNLKLEKSSYKSNLKMLRQMFKWVDKELADSKLKELTIYQDKVIVLSKKQVNAYKYMEQ